MVEPAQGEGTIALGQPHAQLLGRATANHRQRAARRAAAATQHLTGVGIGGQAALIDAVAVMLGHQFLCLLVDADQEVAGGVEGDEALRELFIDLVALG